MTGPVNVPTDGTETSLVSQAVDITAGEDLKIDWALTYSAVVDAAYDLEVDFRTYRDAEVLEIRTFAVQEATAGTKSLIIANTLVDTAPATATITYEVTATVNTATNVTSTAASVNNINILIFP